MEAIIKSILDTSYNPPNYGEYDYGSLRYNWSSTYDSKTKSNNRIGGAGTVNNSNGSSSCTNYLCDRGGATVGGSVSNQDFSYSNLDVEHNPSAILRLKLIGIKNDYNIVDMYRYCNQCGRRIKRRDRYCSACGNRL